MPGKPQVTEVLKVALVEEKSYPKKKDGVPTGETGTLWNIKFIGGRFPSSTFSKTAAGAAEKLVDQEARWTLEERSEWNGVMQYTVQRIDGADGKVIYEPGMDKSPYRGGGGGGGRSSSPEWGFKDPEERHEDRKSIEAQKSVAEAVNLLGHVIQYDGSVASADDALDFVAKAADRLAKAIRKAATDKSGLGSRPTHRSEGGAGGQVGSTGPIPSAGAAGNAPAGDTAQGPALPPDPDRPSPGPDLSVAQVRDPIFDKAVEFFGGQVELQKAYKAHFGKPPNIAEMTVPELRELMGAGVSP